MPEWKHEITKRLSGLKLEPAREAEIVEELAQHLEDRYQELLTSGVPDDEAQHTALEELTGANLLAEELQRIEHPARRAPVALGGGPSKNFLADLWQDLRYGLRQLRRNPGFTAVAIITLALGIGASTAIFTVVNGVLLRPLPLPHSERVLRLWHGDTTCRDCFGSVSVPNFRDWQQQNSVFEGLSLYTYADFSLRGKGSPQRVPGAFVSANYFSVMGVEPGFGRAFLPGEDKAGHNEVAIISSGLWHNQFGGDEHILGKTIFLNDHRVSVVGVMPSWFHFPSEDTEAWEPLVPDPREAAERGNDDYEAVGRLKHGVTLAEARSQMETIAARLARMYPNTNKNQTVRMMPLQQDMVGGIRQDLLVLMVAVAFVFLIACANVVNLQLARTAARQREIAIRVSLGAGWRRLLRQFLAESLVLAGAGAALGWLIAIIGVDALVALKPANLPRTNQIHLDWLVLAFTILLVVVAAILLAVAAVRKASRFNVHEVLKDGGSTGTSSLGRIRGRNFLVAGEVAIALMLLIGAGLMVKSMWRLLQVRSGLDPEHVLTMRISLPESRYRDQAHIARFYGQLLQKVEALPGVENAGAVTLLPLQQSWTNGDFEVEGRPHNTHDRGSGGAEIRAVSPDYYRALGIPLIKGRFFTSDDKSDSPPVLIINQQLAHGYWPHENPVGKRIEIGGEPPWYIVAGVVGNVRQAKLDVPIQNEVDVPYTQWPPSWPAINRTMSLVLRTRVAPASAASAARRAVLSVDPDQPVYSIETMRQVVSRSMAGRRFNMILLSIFAALGLILASLGIYGVLSYAVRQRTHEIGIRVALGATRGDVLRMVIWQGMEVASIGLGCGIVGALALTRLMASLLYGVKATDVETFVATSLVLACVALLACYIPARRATKVDPMVALRYE